MVRSILGGTAQMLLLVGLLSTIPAQFIYAENVNVDVKHQWRRPQVINVDVNACINFVNVGIDGSVNRL